METISCGDRELECGNDVVELRDSTPVKDNVDALRERLAADGYVFIREFSDPSTVRDARRDVLNHMAEDGLLDAEEPIERGVVGDDVGGQFQTFDMTGESWTHYPSLETLAEGEDVMDFFDRLIGEPGTAFDRKLGRAKAPDDYTKFHIDRVFMSLGTDKRYTVWRPIGDCPIEMGPLVICPRSNVDVDLEGTYGRVDAAIDTIEPQLSGDPIDVLENIGGPLATTDFEAGDALIFDPYLLHGALNNQTDRFRISIDTRYQSLYEPTDPRWMGGVTTGAWPEGEDAEHQTPMSELRAQWGFAGA
jgi:ectoine hydroxylase-related dioxygenase (phytanoyl-CoA dioxygenase family)